jgi:hypothetical protein
VFVEGFVAELDEELHFDPWRGATLKNSSSAGRPWVEEYRRNASTTKLTAQRRAVP